jgi:hypothetical protein
LLRKPITKLFSKPMVIGDSHDPYVSRMGI